MKIDQKFYKALLLLDKRNFEQGEILLREIVFDAEKTGNDIYLVKGLVCLGEFLYKEDNWTESKTLLEKVIHISNNNDDLLDIVDFEFQRAQELLDLMQ
jgi:hypothetical protein